MARLSFLGTSIFIASGVIVATAVLPFSSWSFRNQLSAYHPRDRHWSDYRLNDAIGSPVLPDSIWNTSKRDESLARAFATFHRWTPSSFDEKAPYVTRPWFIAFEEHERRFPKDVLGYAAHVRFLCQSPMIKPATEVLSSGRKVSRQESDRQIKQKTEVANKVLDISTWGMRLEPENLFFSYCRMMALNVLGRFEEARQLAFKGAGLKRFEDYAIAEGDDLIRVVERVTGYRGEAFRTIVLASIILPHFASIKGTVREMISRCPPEDLDRLKWSLYQMQYAIARESGTYIGILVGKAGMNLVLADRDEFQSNEKDQDKREAERKRFLEGRAAELAAILEKKGLLKSKQEPARMLEDVERLIDEGKKTVDTYDDPLFSNLFYWPALASRFLLGFVGLLIALPGLLLWSKNSPTSYERARGTFALACAGLFAAVLTIVEQDSVADSVPIILTIPLLVLAVIQARDANLKLIAIAFPIAIFLVTVSAGFLVGMYAAGFVLAFMGLVWLSGRRSWLASILGLLTAGICLFSLRSPEFVKMGILIAIPMALIAGCLLLAFPARWVGQGAACAVLIITVAYAYSVSRDVADNAKLKRFNPQFVLEAAHTRERAGLPRLSREYKVSF